MLRMCGASLVWLGFSAIVPSVNAEGPEPRLVVRAIAEIEKTFSHLEDQFVCEGILEDTRFSDEPIRSRVVFRRNGDFVSLEQYYLKGEEESGRAWVNCRGPARSFFLTKEPDSPFLVREVSARDDDDFEVSTTFKLMDGFVRHYCQTVSGVKGDLSRAARESRLVVESIELSPNEDGLVDVAYRADGDGEKAAHWGTITLDPNSGWAVVRHRLEQSTPQTPMDEANSAIEFRRVGNQLYPGVVSVELFEGDDRLRSLFFRADRIEPRSISDEEFEMTAYGIPTVAVASPSRPGLFSPSGWAFWAALGTAAAAFVVVQGVRLRRSV